MPSDYLISVGSGLVTTYGTRDPFELADCLGIIVKRCPDFGALKGMYTVLKRNRFIFLNQSLDEETSRIVCAHEIGHDRLHRDFAKNGSLKEFTLYDMQSKPEYEANIVCAEILLDTREMLSHIYHDRYTLEQTAQAMHTDKNLVALKAAHLAGLGYDMPRQEYHSDFLRK